MFSIEYINIPTLIAILVIAYLMDDVFLFMKLGNDTTKQLMATVVGYIIAVRKFGYLRFEPFANRFGEENPLYAMGFMRENLRNPNGPHIREEFFLAGGYAGTCNYVQNCIYIVTAVCVQRF